MASIGGQLETGTQIDGADNTTIGNVSDSLKVTAVLVGTGVQGAATVGTTAVLVNVSGTNLANRKLLTVHNNGTVTIYWGYTSGVTTVNGTPLAKGQFMAIAVGPSANIYAISGTAGQNVRITEGL